MPTPNVSVNGQQRASRLDLQPDSAALRSRIFPAIELATKAVEKEIRYRRFPGAVFAADDVDAAMKHLIVYGFVSVGGPYTVDCEE
ncbi:hypothetical protein BE61_31030 [Bradyrhizobium elkanii USDA 61]|nr:hypothetical protein BE61_31030 [Bradyrhizobium elkanii USDA 61]